MKEFKQRRQFQKRLYSKVSIALLIILALFLAKGAFGVFQKSRASKESRDIARIELEELQEREAGIRQQIEFLETDLGAEAEIRKKYNVARAGEVAVVIIDPEVEPVVEEEPGFIKGLWSNVKGWFGN